jgi:uncharacterized protein (DUF2235 family)
MPKGARLRPSERLRGWLTRAAWRQPVPPPAARIHVICLDGTMSSMETGFETNVGLIWQLLQEVPDLSLFYEPGIQWQGWRRGVEVMAGVGINRQIRRAYIYLAQNYHAGDRIYLVGYSRGAYAVRALAGWIERIGLLHKLEATDAMVCKAYNHYHNDPTSAAARAFGQTYCYPKTEIEAVGVFDTVQALGVRLPVLWRFAPKVEVFRSNMPGIAVRHGFHALALDERRMAYAPTLWDVPAHRTDDIRQVWFRGTHGDIGGHLSGLEAARPLSNIPLVWMLQQLHACGLPLPDGWPARFPQDGTAPSVGMNRGFGRMFLLRRARVTGADGSQALHPSVAVGLRPDLPLADVSRGMRAG